MRQSCFIADQSGRDILVVEWPYTVVVPYCYLFLLSVFILWFSYYISLVNFR